MSNFAARALLADDKFIDRAMARHTDQSVWGSWSEALKSVISTAKSSEFHAVRFHCDAGEKILHLSSRPLNEAKSIDPTRASLVMYDVTEKVRTERKLSEAQRLAAVGKVAGKVAHELNNPMDGILRYVNLAERMLKGEGMEKPKEYLAQCRGGLMRMVRIISELLEFSRSTYTVSEYASIDKIIDDAVRTMEAKKEGVDIEVVGRLAGAGGRFKVGNLLQVFCNLIKNAFDAMAGTGKLTITIAQTGEGLQIRFCDSGPGIDAGNNEMLFEPFFTTKKAGRGTGLGLAICRDIVDKYGGTIMAENAPEGGAVFTVCLPVSS
jgi:C4-dicarboxylate-specific signal transduction histidine kinase